MSRPSITGTGIYDRWSSHIGGPWPWEGRFLRLRRFAWRRRFGFRWQIEYELLPGYQRATRDIPAWATSPSAGIMGEWQPIRMRLTWLGVPASWWRRIDA